MSSQLADDLARGRASAGEAGADNAAAASSAVSAANLAALDIAANLAGVAEGIACFTTSDFHVRDGPRPVSKDS